MQAHTFEVVSGEGQKIYVHEWLPSSGTLAGSVLIAHGAAEHGGRYERLAQILTERAYAVYASDHRGHGRTAGTLKNAGDAGADGFNEIISDLQQLTVLIRKKHESKPIFLLGHSMGAALAQRFIQRHGETLRGCILSGSPGLRPNLEQAAAITAKFAEGEAGTRISTVFQQAFASYNTGFEPITTGFEWLSRDDAEVKKYVDDPWCGFPFTNRLVAQMSQSALEAARNENIALIPKSLAILLFSGTQDRVGGNGMNVTALYDRYREAGIRDVEIKLYPDGRHEMLNEISRDEVHRDLVSWLERRR